MTKHTATPWINNKTGIITDANDKNICSCYMHPVYRETDGLMQANAAYIVRCVNSHEALVEACKVSLENHEIGEYESQMQGKPRYCEVLEILRAALKLAGEEY